MKTEHRDIIERAKLAGFEPSMLAHELLVHDLVNMVLFEVKNIHSPWSKLNEGCQQEVIDRAVKSATEAAHTAINIISSRNVEVVEVKVIDAKFKEKAITITANIDANDPNGGALAKVPGKMCLLVLAPTDYDEGLDFIQPDRDQKDLALHVSDLTGSLFASGGASADELASYDDTVPEGQDPLYSDAVVFVIESRRPSISAIQRKLKIGYNRAARMLEGMEQTGIVSAMNSNGAREVLRPVLTTTTGPDEPDGQHPLGTTAELAERTGGAASTGADLGKEFGEFDYDDAAQLIVLKSNSKAFKAHWIQSRLAIDSDKAASLLIRLLDNEVIALESEGETAMDHSYRVIATLADVT